VSTVFLVNVAEATLEKQADSGLQDSGNTGKI